MGSLAAAAASMPERVMRRVNAPELQWRHRQTVPYDSFRLLVHDAGDGGRERKANEFLWEGK